MRRVRARVFEWESRKSYILWWCVSGLRYPACNAHAPYCHLLPCPALQYFSTLSHKLHDFREKVTEHKMCVLIFCTAFVWDISDSKMNWVSNDFKKFIFVCFMYCAAVYSGQILLKPELYRQVKAKLFRVERRTDGHDEDNILFPQFCERFNR
jgi:hypothetical protein